MGAVGARDLRWLALVLSVPGAAIGQNAVSANKVFSIQHSAGMLHLIAKPPVSNRRKKKKCE